MFSFLQHNSRNFCYRLDVIFFYQSVAYDWRDQDHFPVNKLFVPGLWYYNVATVTAGKGSGVSVTRPIILLSNPGAPSTKAAEVRSTYDEERLAHAPRAVSDEPIVGSVVLRSLRIRTLFSMFLRFSSNRKTKWMHEPARSLFTSI